jgi:hypothetical protein
MSTERAESMNPPVIDACGQISQIVLNQAAISRNFPRIYLSIASICILHLYATNFKR